jgi:hypothetical protein
MFHESRQEVDILYRASRQQIGDLGNAPNISGVLQSGRERSLSLAVGLKSPVDKPSYLRRHRKWIIGYSQPKHWNIAQLKCHVCLNRRPTLRIIEPRHYNVSNIHEVQFHNNHHISGPLLNQALALNDFSPISSSSLSTVGVPGA